MGAEAHQNIGRVALGELEHRPVGRGGVVEHAVHAAPVGLGHVLLWNVQPGSRLPGRTNEPDRPFENVNSTQILAGGVRVCRGPSMGGAGAGRVVQADDDAVRDHQDSFTGPGCRTMSGFASGWIVRLGHPLAGGAQPGHRQHLQPFPRDRLGAALARPVRALLEPPQCALDLDQGRLRGQLQDTGDLSPRVIGRGDPLRGVRRELLQLFDAEASLLVQLVADTCRLPVECGQSGVRGGVGLLVHGSFPVS